MTDRRRLRFNSQHNDRLKALVRCWTVEEAKVLIQDYRTDVNQVVDNEVRIQSVSELTKTYKCILSCMITLVKVIMRKQP
jgi:hypothetical protein